MGYLPTRRCCNAEARTGQLWLIAPSGPTSSIEMGDKGSCDGNPQHQRHGGELARSDAVRSSRGDSLGTWRTASWPSHVFLAEITNVTFHWQIYDSRQRTCHDMATSVALRYGEIILELLYAINLASPSVVQCTRRFTAEGYNACPRARNPARYAGVRSSRSFAHSAVVNGAGPNGPPADPV